MQVKMQVHSIGWFALCLWVLFVLFDIAILATIAYVAWHFITKFW